MSAALALDVPVRHHLPSQPRLQLVPTGADVVAAADAPVRLTRLGRMARAAGALVLAIVLGWTVTSAVNAGAAAPARSVTIQSGQTLSEVAVAALPGWPVRDAVARLQLANGLSSSDVHAGQVLQIPAGG